MASTHTWVKGHGTRNDFVLLPDEDGSRYPELDPALVRWLCDRHEGLGADGLIRVTKTASVRGIPAAVRDDLDEDTWFMDYSNADGSLSEMCGNGVRVFVHYLHRRLGVDLPLRVGTRGGVVLVSSYEGEAADAGGREAGHYTVSMGHPTPVTAAGGITVSTDGRPQPATGVLLPNPHAVVLVDDLAEAGALREAPRVEPASAYPEGTNVEYVRRRGDRWIEMRVHERGVGETLSCGTGACAAAWAVMQADGVPPGSTYRVDVPGGTLRVQQAADGELMLSGPAVLTAEGVVAGTL